MSESLSVPVHVGSRSPAHWDEIEARQRALGQDASPGFAKERRPIFAAGDIDWAKYGLEPRWVGNDTSTCAAAFSPSQYFDRGIDEFRRFIAGAAQRQEPAMIVSYIGSLVSQPRRSVLFSSEDSVSLIDVDGAISGTRLGTGAELKIADDLRGADKDLALRIVNRPASLPVWSLKLSGYTLSDGRGHGNERRVEPTGTLTPLVVTSLGDPVAAVWSAPDKSQRHYVLPVGFPTSALLDWVATRALLEFAPSTLRAARVPDAFRADLPTLEEARWEAELREFDSVTSAERSRLRGSLDAALDRGDRIREAMLFGTGAALVDGVAEVLRAAGIQVRDLDESTGRTASADLLVKFDGRHRLVEVKSSNGQASERLYDDLLAHLRIWPTISTDHIDGGVLIVNHQRKIDPRERHEHPYQRNEFLDSVSEPILSTLWLLEAWRSERWQTITDAVFGSAPISQLSERPASDDAAGRSRWRRLIGK